MVKATERRERGVRGRFQAHVPDAESRKLVEIMAGYGLPLMDIANLMGLRSIHTLKKHYPEEMENGIAKGNLDVAKQLFLAAVGRPAEWDGRKKVREEMRPNPALLMFLGKTRLGLVESEKIVVTVNDIDLTRLTDKEAETLALLMAKADRRAPIDSVDAEISPGGGNGAPAIRKAGTRAPSEPE